MHIYAYCTQVGVVHKPPQTNFDKRYQKLRYFFDPIFCLRILDNACQVIVLIGESTKHLYKYVRWELQVVLDLELPLIAVNLDNRRSMNTDLCPPLIRDKYIAHIPFKLAIIKYALDNFPNEFKNRDKTKNGPRTYSGDVYKKLGLD